MSKSDNAHSIRPVDSLDRNAGHDIAKEFEEKYPLSQSANIEKKYEWAKIHVVILKRILIQTQLLK